ncbi:MAG: DUF5906 domain-containing protein [Cyanobacteria bacterium P01_C01_bin.38]
MHPILLPIYSSEDSQDLPIKPKLKMQQQEGSFYHIAIKHFFGNNHWICIDDNLYEWQEKDKYYKKVPDEHLIGKIQQYCWRYPPEFKNGELKYPYASTRTVEEILKLQKNLVTVSADKINPPGINCTNGILIINWEGNIPLPQLIKHDPTKYYYTYPPLVAYDKNADPKECDRLLKCLDEPEREVFLRNVAASIDLPKVRKLRGREVKLLLLCGSGSNGKDALRRVVSTIFGDTGMTSCSLRDFAAYDKGRKFNLSALKGSRINWASENPQVDKIDTIQSLKVFATGDKLHSERKGKDHIEFTPTATGFFNINSSPNLERKLQAIIDRIAIVQFRKVFKTSPNPNNPNELLADSRFVYDKDFIANDVAPAFLNKMLSSLTDLCDRGIDYSCTETAFKNIQQANNHLFQFCSDFGIVSDESEVVSASKIFKLLEDWYKTNGYLVIDDNNKRVWFDQTSASDKNVKAINQVIPRFLEVFPDAKRTTVPHPIHGRKRPIPALKGISTHERNEAEQNQNGLTVEKNTGIIENSTTTARSVSTGKNPYTASIPQPAREVN